MGYIEHIMGKNKNKKLVTISFSFFKTVFKSFFSDVSSPGSSQDLRTGGRWFDHRLGQYSF